ncbi:tyrosine phosphatase family-domain-containing protein [Powellomyces hirtus]|nr:tyrosine phosphatase family-domain-containing protein [Powellomyces hirtus]
MSFPPRLPGSASFPASINTTPLLLRPQLAPLQNLTASNLSTPQSTASQRQQANFPLSTPSSATQNTPLSASSKTPDFTPLPYDGTPTVIKPAADDTADDELYPTENFNMIVKGVYRSAFPKKKNFSFLKKLGLKSILTLILEDYPDQNQKFMEENNIQLFQFGVAGNKEPFVDIPEDTICAALTVLLDRRNHPILIHCNKGKHRTGCLVGCLRKLQHWSHTSIFDEYRRFSHPKSRSMDQQFIELFDAARVEFDENYLPDWPEIEGMAANKRAMMQGRIST